MNSSPAPALADRGIVGNVRGCLDRVAPGLGILTRKDRARALAKSADLQMTRVQRLRPGTLRRIDPLPAAEAALP